jgi:hypothetical protein
MTKNETHRPKTEPTLEDLQGKVAAAQEALLNKARSAPHGEWLDPEKLRTAARNGSGGDVMMFALTDLVNQGKLDLHDDLRVRLHSDAG